MEDFEGLDDATIQQLMSLGVIPDQIDSLKDQITQAQKLRNQGQPRGTDTGRVYVAASPLEHAAAAMQGIMAKKDMDKARLEQQKLLAAQIRGRSAYFDKMNEISPVTPSVSRQGPPPGGY